MSSNEFVVGVKLQADDSQYTATFLHAGQTAQAFTAQLTGAGQQASTGLQAVAAEASKMGASVGTSGQAAAAGLGATALAAQATGTALQTAGAQGRQGLDSLTQASRSVRTEQSQADTVGQQFLRTLREQIATSGKSAEELLRYRAAQSGVAQEASHLILQWQNQKAAQLAAADAAQKEEAAQREAAASKRSAQAAADSFIQGLRDQAATQGLSAAELLRYRAAQLGVSESAAPYLRALDDANKANGRGAISAGQHAAAMRMLPAQMTDVVTSVASGMPIWLVAIQQGGQIKDSFGGAGNAARAMLGSITPLAAGLGVLAVGIGATVAAYYQGSAEADRYRQSIVLSGNAAAVTVEQLSRMAREVDKITGTQSDAAAGLALMARSNKIGSDSFVEFTAMAVAMKDSAGKAVSDTVKELEELGKKPADASAKLNEQYNYLTPTIYRQIKALEDQGKTEEAAALAQKTYSSAMSERAKQLDSELGYVERGWKAAKDAAADAWDKFLNIGRPTTVADQADEQIKLLEEKIRQHKELLASRGQQPGKYSADLEKQLETAKGLSQVSLSAGKAIADAVDRENKARQTGIDLQREAASHATKAEKRARELAEAEGKYGEHAKTSAQARLDYERVIAGIKDKYKDPKSSTAGQVSITDTQIAGLKSQLQAAQQYHQQLLTLGASASELNAGERESLKLAEQIKLATNAKTKAKLEQAKAEADALGVQLRTNDGLDKSLKSHQALIDATNKDATSIEARAREQEAANTVIGKGRTAIEQMTLATLENQMVEAQRSDRFDPLYIEGLERKIAAQKRYVDALGQADYKAVIAHADELLRNAQELSKEYDDELALSGLTGLEREKIVAQRTVELKYAKEIAAIENGSLTDAEKLRAKEKVYAAQRVESAAAGAKAQQTYMGKASEEINRNLTDALMRGFENGKGFAENLADTTENLFKSMVLRPVISAVMAPVSGGINGVVQSGLNAVGLGGSGVSGTKAPLMFSDFGGSMSDSVAMLGSKLFNTPLESFGDSLIDFSGTLKQYSGVINTAGSVLSYGKALLDIGDGKYGSGIGTAVGQYFGGPIGATIGNFLGGALDKAFGSRGANHSGGAYSTASADRNTAASQALATDAWGNALSDITQRGNTEIDKKVGETVNALSDVYKSLSQFATDAREIDIAAAFAVNGKHGDEDRYGYYSIIDKVSGEAIASYKNRNLGNDDAAAYTKFATNLTNGVFSKLRSSGLEKWVDDTLAKLGDAPSLEALATAVAQITAAQAALTQFGLAMPQFAAQSEAARAALMDHAGGSAALVERLGSFYSNYFSEAERTAVATQQVTEQLQALGYAMPSTRDEYRAWVTTAIDAGESGTKSAAGLLKLESAVAQLLPASKEAAAGVTEAAKALRSAADISSKEQDLQIQLLRAQGNELAAVTLERQRELSALGEYGTKSQELQRQIYAAQDTATAAAAAQAKREADAAEAQAQAERIAQERLGLESQLLQLLGDTTALRARELAALDASNRSLQERIWSVEDAQVAQEAARNLMQSAYSGVERAVTAERSAINARLQAQQAGNKAQIEAAQEASRAVQSIAAALSRAAKTVQVESVQQDWRRLQDARSLIDGATQAPDVSKVAGLEDALSVAGQDSRKYYSNFADYAFDQAVTAGVIKSLDARAQQQLSTAEAVVAALSAQDQAARAIADEQLLALDEQLNTAKLQLDAALGQIEETKSVSAAIADLADATRGYAAATAAAVVARASATSSIGMGGSAGAAGSAADWVGSGVYYQDFNGNTIEVQAGQSLDFWQTVAAAGTSAVGSLQELRERLESAGKSDVWDRFAGGLQAGKANWGVEHATIVDRAGDLVVVGPSDKSGAIDWLAQNGLLSSTAQSVGGALAGAKEWSHADIAREVQSALASGASVSDVLAGGQANYGVSAQDINAAAKAAGIPGFAVGTNYLPHDMLVLAHQGERIFPAADNRRLFDILEGRSGDASQASTQLRVLDTLLRMEPALRSIASSTFDAANALAKQLDRAELLEALARQKVQEAAA